MKKPTPIHTDTICSVCGLDWSRHGDKPTLETCVDLLAADLTSEKRRTAPIAPTYPVPYPYPVPAMPPPQPFPWIQPRPYWRATTAGAAAPANYTTRIWNTTGGNYQ